MNFKLKHIAFILFIPTILLGQAKLTPEQIKEDYTIFKSILEKGHPSLYEYTNKTEWDSLFTNFENKIEHLKNSDDLFKSISLLAENVKDGHLMVIHPKMESIPPLFPLVLKILDGDFYTDTDDFGIPVGSKIISINGKNSNEIFHSLSKYITSDGYNQTRKYRKIEVAFGVLYFYEFGAINQHQVIYLTPNGENKTVEIQSQGFNEIRTKSIYRNSLFSNYHQAADKAAHFENTTNQKWPYVRFIDSLNTAILTANSFGVDIKEFNARLIPLFKQIKKQRVHNLIIDVRQNEGGYRPNAIHLFSYLTDEPFKQRTSEIIKTKTLPEEKYAINTYGEMDAFFSEYFGKAEKKDDNWVLTEDHSEVSLKPNKERFKGKIYVLIGGKTFSAGTAFALSAKNDSKITLVGEETGGGYYFHTGQYPVSYELPNSKIQLLVSLVKINHFVKDDSVPKGSGVLPDYDIKFTLKELIEGKDSQLDYILQQIRKN